jgi:spore coat polysaccharide biosynthesis protein SpsF
LANKLAIAIIQARMSSTRLPGKVLLPLKGKPIIHHIIDRAKSCKNVGKVVVATSIENSDSPLVKYCQENNIEYYGGSLNNVLGRFIAILNLNNYDYCVRITGDCPLIHPPFIDAQIEALQQFSADLIWMKDQASVLEGQGVISSKALIHVSEKSKDPDDLEHVGSKYFLNNKDEFKYVELKIPKKYYKYNYRLTVDEKNDYEFIENIYNQNWDSQPIRLTDVISWLDGLDKSKIKNKHILQSQINQELNIKRKSFKPNIVGSCKWGGV